MNCISINYQLKWRISNTDYCITSCLKVVNVKTNRVKIKTINNGVVGYWIGRKFVKLSDINNMVELIKKEKCPF